MNDYKLDQLKLMLEAEKSTETGGYGAHLTHWAGKSKPINLDAEALQVLIDYYSNRQEDEQK